MINGTCKLCGAEFTTDRPYKQYCTEFCRNKAYCKNNKDIVTKTKVKYASSPENREKRSIASKKVREANIPLSLWRSAKNRSAKYKIPFSIDVSDIVVPEFCPILGIKLEVHSGTPGGKKTSYSLDKIIPDLGYVKGNVQVISLQANMMKSNASDEELLAFAKWVTDKHENNRSNS